MTQDRLHPRYPMDPTKTRPGSTPVTSTTGAGSDRDEYGRPLCYTAPPVAPENEVPSP